MQPVLLCFRVLIVCVWLMWFLFGWLNCVGGCLLRLCVCGGFCCCVWLVFGIVFAGFVFLVICCLRVLCLPGWFYYLCVCVSLYVVLLLCNSVCLGVLYACLFCVLLCVGLLW